MRWCERTYYSCGVLHYFRTLPGYLSCIVLYVMNEMLFYAVCFGMLFFYSASYLPSVQQIRVPKYDAGLQCMYLHVYPREVTKTWHIVLLESFLYCAQSRKGQGRRTRLIMRVVFVTLCRYK